MTYQWLNEQFIWNFDFADSQTHVMATGKNWRILFLGAYMWYCSDVQDCPGNRISVREYLRDAHFVKEIITNGKNKIKIHNFTNLRRLLACTGHWSRHAPRSTCWHYSVNWYVCGHRQSSDNWLYSEMLCLTSQRV